MLSGCKPSYRVKRRRASGSPSFSPVNASPFKKPLPDWAMTQMVPIEISEPEAIEGLEIRFDFEPIDHGQTGRKHCPQNAKKSNPPPDVIQSIAA